MAGVDKITSFLKKEFALDSVVIATDTDTNSDSVDIKDFNAVCLVLAVGDYTDGDFTMKLQDSPDDSVWSDVGANYTINKEAADTADSLILSAKGTRSLGYYGVQQFLRAVVTSATTTSGATVSVLALEGHKRNVNTDAGA